MTERSRPIPKVRPEERRSIRREGCDREPPDALRLGVGQFNVGQYWECHETLEELWVAEPADVRYLYQGILLIGVGMLHLRRHNQHGATTKLASGLDLLRPFEPSCMRIDVATLRSQAARVLDLLDEGPEGLVAALAHTPPRCVFTELGAGDETFR
jgi:hypothetical protein